MHTSRKSCLVNIHWRDLYQLWWQCFRCGATRNDRCTQKQYATSLLNYAASDNGPPQHGYTKLHMMKNSIEQRAHETKNTLYKSTIPLSRCPSVYSTRSYRSPSKVLWKSDIYRLQITTAHGPNLLRRTPSSHDHHCRGRRTKPTHLCRSIWPRVSTATRHPSKMYRSGEAAKERDRTDFK